MELHERFEHTELRETIFGYAPEYTDKYDLAIFLRRIVILSAAFARVYYKNKKNQIKNITSKILDRIVERPYISVDNSISFLTALQSAGEDLEQLGLSELKILSDENHSDYINLYDIKAVLQDETGKFYDASSCREMINKVIACIGFITVVDIKNDEDSIWLTYHDESFDISDLFRYEFCYLYRALQEVDPLKTTFIQL